MSFDITQLNIRASLTNVWMFAKPIIALLLIWEIVVQLNLVPPQMLPHVSDVAMTFSAMISSGALVEPTYLTLMRAILALILSVLLGVMIGLLMARFEIVKWFFDPIISIGFPIPKVTLVPIYLLWFGFGTRAAVLLAATSAIFPVIIATHNGAKSVDRELIWSVRTMGVSKLESMWKVILPAALPQIFNGIQIAVFLSFVVVVVAEMVTSGGGLGQLLVQSTQFFNTEQALVVLITIISLGLVTNAVFQILRSYLLRWT